MMKFYKYNFVIKKSKKRMSKKMISCNQIIQQTTWHVYGQRHLPINLKD